MAQKPKDHKAQDKAPREGAPIDAVQTKQEIEAGEANRKAETALATAQDQSAAAPHKTHPKVHKEDETGAIQDISDEPVIEDEP